MTDRTISLWFETALLPSGWAKGVRLRGRGGAIETVAVDSAPLPGDERHAIALPGLGNVHSHAFQRGMAGLTEVAGATADNFWSWRNVMYRFLDRMTPDDVEAISAFAFAEMLEAGFTRVGEFHYLHHAPDGRPYADIAELSGRIAAAAEAAGIALTLLPVFYAHAGFGGAPPSAGQRRFINDLDSFARLHERAVALAQATPDGRTGVAPHSLRAVTPQELEAVIGLGAQGPIHIHAAEQTGEVDACLAWSGRRPVEWLLDNANVDGRWCLIHATHLSADETRRLAASGAVAGLCPVTEANLGDGVFPAKAFVEAGGAFGVGTDSNIAIDAAAELRGLEYAQRLVERRRNVIAASPARSTGAGLFCMALAGGAKALGAGPAGLEVGAPLDVVSLDPRHPALVARTGDALLDAWIFAARSGPIDCVWRAGHKQVAEGRHIRKPPIEAAYRRAVTRLLSA